MAAEPQVGRDLHGLISRVTRREQAFALRSEIRERGCLSDARVEISGRDGAPISLELSVIPLSDRPDEAGLSAVIARPEVPREPIATIPLRASGFEAALLAGSPDAIVVVDAQGILRHANRAVEILIGRPSAELVGRPVALLCCGARDLDAVLSALR